MDNKNSVGRPTVCTPELTEEFAKLMAAGNYFETSCDYLQLDKTLAYDWIKFGKEGKLATGNDPQAYIAFSNAVTRAESHAEISAVANLHNAGKPHELPKHLLNDDGSIKQGVVMGDWRAIVEFLKRRHPDKWADKSRQQVELTGKDGGAVLINIIPFEEEPTDA